jgi:hypothetical protein
VTVFTVELAGCSGRFPQQDHACGLIGARDPSVRSGWTLMAGQLEEHDREELLDTIEKRMKAAPFRTQEPMNYCLVKIAVDYPPLRKRAIAIGNKLEVLKDYPVPKGCTSPFAPIWIAYILEHR